jgi:hypothetical protein
VHLPAVRQVEPDVQIGHLEHAHSASGPLPTSGRSRQRRSERWATRKRGLSASSIAWPNRKQPTITVAMTKPSGTIAHHAPELMAVRWKACSRMVPHVEAGVLQPEKARAVSR